jgi:hypothetical protein
MYLNKVITIAILLMCCGTTHAWTDEVAIADNETMDINFNPAINGSSSDNPYHFSDSDIQDTPYSTGTYVSNDPVTMNFAYTIYKQVWDASGSVYVNTDCNVTIETSVTLSYNSVTGQYEKPANFAEITSNGYMVKKYFQDLINSDSQYCSEFNTTDDTSTPDVFYTAIDIDVGDGDEYHGEMYVTIDDQNKGELATDESPYGYAFGGRGSAGGSGAIYNDLNMYGETGGDESGMGDTFDMFFWLFIPIIFLLAVAKFIGRII